MRGGTKVDRGDALRRDVSDAGWVDHCPDNPSDTGSGGRQGLRAGRGYRSGDDASGYRAGYPEFGRREE